MTTSAVSNAETVVAWRADSSRSTTIVGIIGYIDASAHGVVGIAELTESKMTFASRNTGIVFAETISTNHGWADSAATLSSRGLTG